MNGGQTSEPALFSKRSRKVQKRRRVNSQLPGPHQVDTTNASSGTGNSTSSFSGNAALHVAASNKEDSLATQDSARSRPYSVRVKPRVRTKLKQAPVVPGYEPDSDPVNELQASYTKEQLKQLKQKLRISPHSRPPLPHSSQELSLRDSKHTSEHRLDEGQLPSPSNQKVGHSSRSNQQSQFSQSQPPQTTTAKLIPGTATAAPFSAEWNAGIYDDDDIEVEPVSNFTRVEAAGSDSESADVEWEAQLMRRAAQKTTQEEQYMLRRDMNIIRDAEMESLRTGAFKRLKADIGKRIDELAEQQAYVEQKVERLAQVVQQDTGIKGNANASVEDMRRKVGLYEDLVQRISTVSRSVADSIEVFERWESFVDGEMSKRIEQVNTRLNGGIDEFGRAREAQILDIEEVRENFKEFGVRLVEHEQKEVTELREKLGFEEIMRLANDWRETFPEEYNSAFADVALGKLLGRLALLENDIGFVCKLDERQEMIKTAVIGFGVERFATWIKARWEPRLCESCEFVGDLMRAMNAAPEDMNKLVRSALQNRLELEIEAHKSLGDEGIRQVVRGLVTVARKGQFDPGFVKAIQACDIICGLNGFEEVLEWLANSSFVRNGAGEIRQWRDKLRLEQGNSNSP